MELKDLELTEQDFNLILDGLTALPEKETAGNMLHDLMIHMFLSDKSVLAKHELEAKERKQKEKAGKQALKEDIKILEGKLIMLKRYLQSQNALKEVNDYLHK